jgi:hypothetical protein
MSYNILWAPEETHPRGGWLTAASLAFFVMEVRLLARMWELVRTVRLAISGNGAEEPLG